MGITQPTIAAVLTLAVAGGCRTLPESPPKTASYAEPPVQGVRLERVSQDVAARHGTDLCGFLPLDSNQEALAWRLALVDSAEKTLDAKYFIWSPDAAGSLLFDRLVRAADRGVRVRLLIDDLLVMGREEGLAVINAHPNIETRIYNPWRMRGAGWSGRIWEGMSRFEKVNHRMHNKLMVADNHLAITGGRNVGNEYFGLQPTYNFRDFDVLVAGPIVPELSKSFDVFWNDELAYPGEFMSDEEYTEADFREAYADFVSLLEGHAAQLASFPVATHDWSEQLDALPSRMSAGTARVVRDDPGDEWSDDPDRLAYKLADLLLEAKHEILVSSPYLIAPRTDMPIAEEIIAKGVKFRILTNSLASIDTVMAYTGYRKCRARLLKVGIDLYELRADAASRSISDTPPIVAEWLGLHSKLIVIDRQRVYVGTYNFDPRSTFINSEMGIIVDDPVLAGAIADILERDMSPDNAWHVTIGKDKFFVWESSAGVRHSPPSRGVRQRIDDAVIGTLPLEGQM